MLEMGKTNPESISVGRNDASSATWNATCCVSATLEMNRPRPSAPKRNNDIAATSSSQDPRIGMPKSAIETNTTPSDEARANAEYGSGLPTTDEPAGGGR